MNRRSFRSRGLWATIGWLTFLVLMCVRIGVAQASAGVPAMLLTFALIAVGTAALYAAIVWAVTLKRRPLRRVLEYLRAKNPGSVVVIAMGTDDFFLGLRLFPDATHPYGRRTLLRLFVIAFAENGVRLWNADLQAGPVIEFDPERVVGLHRENVYGPTGSADTAVLVVRGADEIVLPFLVISDRGTGLKPMDGRALDELFTEISRAGAATRRGHMDGSPAA